MNRETALQNEADAILASSPFTRSAALSKLLKYLLDRELNGDRAPTQYEIAVEALGKSAGFDMGFDSAARVQVSRLRKALCDYYALREPKYDLCVHLRKGEYRLRLARRDIAFPQLAEVRPLKIEGSATIQPTPGESRRLLQIGMAELGHGSLRSPERLLPNIIGVLCALFILFATYQGIASDRATSPGAAERAPLAVPEIYASVTLVDTKNATALDQGMVANLRADIRSQLHKSLISRLTDARSSIDVERPDYFVDINIFKNDEDAFRSVFVVRDRKNRVVVERTTNSARDFASLHDQLIDQTIGLISPAGSLADDIENRITGHPRNDFECFIRVESERSKGDEQKELLNGCLRQFFSGEFTGFLRVRQLFGLIQERMRSGRVMPEDPLWHQLTEILADNPRNPFANAVAAKLLIAQGRCRDAATFASESFSRGRTYPALELSVIVDAYGCAEVAELRPRWDQRIERIARANPNPHPLLRSYILLGAIVSGKPAIGTQQMQLFPSIEHSSLAAFNGALVKVLNSDAGSRDLGVIEATLPTLLFSSATRDRISQRMHARAAEDRSQKTQDRVV